MKLLRPSVPAWPLTLWLVPGLAVLVAVVVTGSGSTVSPTPAPATNPPDPVPAGRDDPRAIALLKLAQRAAAQVPYSGVEYVAAWCHSGTVSQVVDVTHVPGTGSLVAVHGTPVAAGSTVFTAENDPSGTSTALADGTVALLAKNYQVVLAGRDAVAGRPTLVVEARRSSGTTAARVWVDEHSGLVLRREVFDRSGAMTKASAFVDLTIGRASMGGKLPEPMPTAWADEVPVSAVPRLREAGWSVPATIPPHLELTDVRRPDGDDGTVLHLTYTDGLSIVSVFQQRGHLDVGGLDGFHPAQVGAAKVYVQDGVPYRATWSAAGIVYTVVGDAPDEVAEGIMAAFPHEATSTGVMARLTSGVGRVASWFNPFG